MRWRCGRSSVLLFISCATLPVFALLARGGASQGPLPSARSEVVFIGANHNFTFLHPAFSPAHLRALLSKIAPAALCLEIPPERPRTQGIPTFPQEQYAAMTWAQREGIPVYGVDWETPEGQAQSPVVRMDNVEPLEQGDRFARFRESYVGTVQWTAAQAFGEASNDIESYQRTQPSLAVDRWPEEEIGARVREDRIAENIRAVLAKHPGGRIVVVFGTAHYLPLKRRLESTEAIGVLPPSRYFPLEPDRLEEGWHPDDAILLLGTNLDDWRSIGFPQSRNHQRTKELLDRLRRERSNSVVTRYYEARWLMLFGDLDKSRPVLRRIADGGGASVLPYQADVRWSWPPLRTFEQKARFYLAVANDLAGDHSAAAKEYRALLNLPEGQLVVPAIWPAIRLDLRPYFESLVKTPYRGGVFEAYRAFLAIGG
jgi:hypothetical protein